MLPIIAVARKTNPFLALCELARTLDVHCIPYVVAGSLALSLHGYHRFSNDIDLIVTSESLLRIRQCLDVNRYLTVDPSGNRLLDTTYDVNIDLLVSGDYPGGRKPKVISFPVPAECHTVMEGFKCLPLESLVELKLASGQSNPRRMKDLSDVQELIVIHSIPREFVALLHPWVQAKFLEIYPDTFDPED